MSGEKLPPEVTLPANITARIRRESKRSGEEWAYDILAAESVARRWFLSAGLPCWGSPLKLGEDGRYSLLFPSGRRALAALPGRTDICFDDMAGAKCQYLLMVDMSGEVTGSVRGFYDLLDIRMPDDLHWKPDLEVLEPRSMEHFPEIENRPDHFRTCYFLGSLRLIFIGEMKTPPPVYSQLEQPSITLP